MELLFLNETMKSHLRKNIQTRLQINDWIALFLALLGTFFAVIAVSALHLRNNSFIE